MIKVLNTANKKGENFTYVIVISLLVIIILSNYNYYGSLKDGFIIIPLFTYFIYLVDNVYIFLSQKTKLSFLDKGIMLVEEDKKTLIFKSSIKNIAFEGNGRNIKLVITFNDNQITLENIEYFYLLPITRLAEKTFVLRILYELKMYDMFHLMDKNSLEEVTKRLLK